MSEHPAFLPDPDELSLDEHLDRLLKQLDEKTATVYKPRSVGQSTIIGAAPNLIILDDLDEYGSAPLPRTLSQAVAREPRRVVPEAAAIPEKPVWRIYAMYGAIAAVFILAGLLRWL